MTIVDPLPRKAHVIDCQLHRFLRTKEELLARIYDLMRPSLTQDGIVSEEIQRKSLEHVVERAGLKEPLRLELVIFVLR